MLFYAVLYDVMFDNSSFLALTHGVDARQCNSLGKEKYERQFVYSSVRRRHTRNGLEPCIFKNKTNKAKEKKQRPSTQFPTSVIIISQNEYCERIIRVICNSAFI
mmetsp:Transcript_20454/g.43258  ORF Transcript_20454/g.43258 Transcript_20454/m.43258 type:complete len:105 (-) Transcript_20454:832-1146(-)